MLDLPVIKRGRIRDHPGIEKFDRVGPLQAGGKQATGKRVCERNSRPFGKGIADEQDASGCGSERDVAHPSVAKAQAVGDERVANVTPAVVAVEIAHQGVVIRRMRIARPLVFLVQKRRINEIHAEEEQDAVDHEGSGNDGAPHRHHRSGWRSAGAACTNWTALIGRCFP